MSTVTKPSCNVCAAVIIQERTVLLLERIGATADDRLWTFPGGGNEPGENDLFCLMREVFEELGRRVFSVSHFGSVEGDGASDSERVKLNLFLVKLHVSDGVDGFQLDSESTAYRWFSRSEIADCPNITEATRKGLDLLIKKKLI